MKLLPLLGLAFLLGLSQNAWSGTIIDLKSTGEGSSEPGKSFFQDGKLRMDTDSKNDKGSMIYDSKTKVFWLIDHKEKRYTRLDDKSIDKIISKMNQAKAKLEKQLASMPKAQQDMMRGMMGGMLSNDKPKHVYSMAKTGKTDSAAGVSCKKVVWKKDGVISSEMCIARLSDIPDGKAMFNAYKSMTQMFSKFLEAMPMGADEALDEWEQFKRIDGFPIKNKEYKDGKVVSTSTLSSIKEENIDASMFKIPKGYKEQNIEQQMKF